MAGTGGVVVEDRAVGEFDRVELGGEGAVVVAAGTAAALTVETDENLLDLLETSVDDGVLRIRTEEGVDIEPSTSVTYRVVAPDLTEVAITGAGSIDVETWVADTSRIVLSGVGDIRVGSITSESLVVEHTGVGSISVGGAVDVQEITMSCVGELQAADLQSAVASIDIAGACAATVWVTDMLSVTASDTSSVAYRGSPELTQQIEGLASITALEEG